MKKKLLIATHSVFADGIKNAMELVTGEQNSVSTLCAYTNDMTEVETPIKEIIDALCDDEELIVTTDIFGGSVNNEFNEISFKIKYSPDCWSKSSLTF